MTIRYGYDSWRDFGSAGHRRHNIPQILRSALHQEWKTETSNESGEQLEYLKKETLLNRNFGEINAQILLQPQIYMPVISWFENWRSSSKFEGPKKVPHATIHRFYIGVYPHVFMNACAEADLDERLKLLGFETLDDKDWFEKNKQLISILGLNELAKEPDDYIKLGIFFWQLGCK